MKKKTTVKVTARLPDGRSYSWGTDASGKRTRVVEGKDTLKLGGAGSLALALGSLLDELKSVERALTCVLENREDREAARLTPIEEDVLFAAWHATRGAVALLRARDPWKEIR